MLDDGVPSIDVCSRINICERQIYFDEFLAVFRHSVSVSCGCYKYRIIDEFCFLNQDYRGFMDLQGYDDASASLYGYWIKSSMTVECRRAVDTALKPV